ncbi:hypothetical protein EA462_07775 [Natrarchaeobius halalkaliphilus]|uniref:Uncharacterized protein n=1 Tax=Natrarchaeobius halalkaliphilus TaxID=1679091 RepID=A0A3N6M3V6_9EURY|nr:hypothetical protein EA462_07775 [Natrarchaeobius halalkaliphilus]
MNVAGDGGLSVSSQAPSPVDVLDDVPVTNILYMMLELGYELPDLDSLLLWSSRDPNPHRPRLREQVESYGLL